MDFTRRSLVAGAAAAAGLGWQRPASADVPAAIRGIDLAAAGDGARLSVALDRPAEARTFFLSSPDRFVLDLANARLAQPWRGANAVGSLVAGYRSASRPDGSSRIVLDLSGPGRLVRQERDGRSPTQLHFDVAPFAAGTPPPPLELHGRSARVRTIVVDAGHGGRDPGAVGATGVLEKDVVLDAALQLRAALEGRGGYRVALTRDEDRFIALDERVRFARAQNADLFISLHADSAPNAETQGAAVYTLSERGADRAQDMMSAQNWTVELGDAPRQGVTRDILVDLFQRETTNRSAQFAQLVLPRLGQVTPLLRNSHRSAGFFVLLAPDVPAVLIETGFLSNVADERRLADPRARQAMADAMAQAVDAYFAAPALYAARA